MKIVLVINVPSVLRSDPRFLDVGERVLVLKRFLLVITNVYLMRLSKTLAGRDLKLKLELTTVLPSCT